MVEDKDNTMQLSLTLAIFAFSNLGTLSIPNKPCLAIEDDVMKQTEVEHGLIFSMFRPTFPVPNLSVSMTMANDFYLRNL